MLLIMGLGAQMTVWPIGFYRWLAQPGYYVIRFDNRDIGASSKHPQRARIANSTNPSVGGYGGLLDGVARKFLHRDIVSPYRLENRRLTA